MVISLLFILSLFSAQFAEFYSPCVDEVKTTASVEAAQDHTDHNSNAQDHHCHKACAQCHNVVYYTSFSGLNSDIYSDELTYSSFVLTLNDYQLSVDRPPAFIV